MKEFEIKHLGRGYSQETIINSDNDNLFLDTSTQNRGGVTERIIREVIYVQPPLSLWARIKKWLRN